MVEPMILMTASVEYSTFTEVYHCYISEVMCLIIASISITQQEISLTECFLQGQHVKLLLQY